MGHKHHKHKCCGYEKYECFGPGCGCNNSNNLFSGFCGGCGSGSGKGCNNNIVYLILLALFCRR